MGERDPQDVSAAQDEQPREDDAAAPETDGPGGVTVDEPTDAALDGDASEFGFEDGDSDLEEKEEDAEAQDSE